MGVTHTFDAGANEVNIDTGITYSRADNVQVWILNRNLYSQPSFLIFKYREFPARYSRHPTIYLSDTL